VAYGAIQAIRQAGLTIPGDISIVGFDDDLLSRYLNPPLTTMSVPAGGLGGTAARLLIDMLDEKPPPVTNRSFQLHKPDLGLAQELNPQNSLTGKDMIRSPVVQLFEFLPSGSTISSG